MAENFINDQIREIERGLTRMNLRPQNDPRTGSNQGFFPPGPSNAILHGHVHRSNPMQNPSSSVGRNVEVSRDLTEMLLEMASDRVNCPKLVDIIGRSVPAIRRLVFRAVRVYLADLAVHKHGNSFVQKLIALLEREDLLVFIITLTSQLHTLRRICTDDIGNKVMLKLVEHLRWDVILQAELMEGLSQIAVDLTTSAKCKQLVENCLELFDDYSVQNFLNEIAKNWMEIATTQHGCCILQKCFRPDNRQMFECLLYCAILTSIRLTSHEFGNYIMQYVVGLRVPGVALAIAKRMRGDFKSLSVDIHASNVVEKLMKADQEVAVMIIREIMQDPSDDLLQILQDQYGNFVAQTALDVTRSTSPVVYNGLKRFIELNFLNLNNHPHGRNVVRAIRYGTRHSNNRRR